MRRGLINFTLMYQNSGTCMQVDHIKLMCLSCIHNIRFCTTKPYVVYATLVARRWPTNCRPSPSNQRFYRVIAGYQRGAGDHRVYRPMMRGVMGLQIIMSNIPVCMHACKPFINNCFKESNELLCI
jgi:hypothetical protein